MPGPLPPNPTPMEAAAQSAVASGVGSSPMNATSQQAVTAGVAPNGGGQIGAAAVAGASNGVLVGTVGPEIPPITMGINAIVEFLKHLSRFDERFAFSYMVALWLVVSVVWGFIKGDPTHSILMLFGGIGNSHFTHEGLRASGTGIIKPVPPEKQFVKTENPSIRPLILALTLGALVIVIAAVIGVAVLVNRLR